MKSKTLAFSNSYLRSIKSDLLVARNVASSTAVETGKPSQTYVTRYQDSCSGRPVAANNSRLPQKSAS